jgi:dynein heavy chain, axonemal
LENSTRKQQIFEEQKKEAEIKLFRAEKLLGGLSGEAVRWKENVKKLTNDLNNLTGNILLAAANISYLGPFTYEYRIKMNQDWIKECQLQDIPVSKDFSLENILSDEVQIREWQENGLPSDNLSIENGIFIF